MQKVREQRLHERGELDPQRPIAPLRLHGARHENDLAPIDALTRERWPAVVVTQNRLAARCALLVRLRLGELKRLARLDVVEPREVAVVAELRKRRQAESAAIDA